MQRFSFERYVGNSIRVELDDGRVYEGELVDMDADAVVMKVEEDSEMTPLCYFRMRNVKCIDFEYLIEDNVEVSKPARLLTLKMANA